jgi:hypothetical protein
MNEALPLAFTEHGTLALASVLRNDVAVQAQFADCREVALKLSEDQGK